MPKFAQKVVRALLYRVNDSSKLKCQRSLCVTANIFQSVCKISEIVSGVFVVFSFDKYMCLTALLAPTDVRTSFHKIVGHAVWTSGHRLFTKIDGMEPVLKIDRVN